MSIINDALKKLQAQLSHAQVRSADIQSSAQSAPLTAAQQAGFEPVPSLYSPSNQSQPKPAEKSSGSKLAIILGLLCLLTALFSPIVNKQSVIGMLLTKIPKRATVATAKSLETTPPKATPAVNTMPAAEQKPQPIRQIVKNLTAPITKPQLNTSSRIIINGIMTHGEQNLALIDGQVYQEGEEVDGVKILKITPKGVTVLENGDERFVKVMGQ
jgi:hypothetical protein